MEAHPLYSELRHLMDSVGNKDTPVTKTSLWQYSVYRQSGCSKDDSIYISRNPPVLEASPSERFLVCSTRSEGNVFNKIFGNKSDNKLELQEEAKNFLKVFHQKHLPVEDMNVNKIVEIRDMAKSGGEIQYCFCTDTFWQNFFNTKYFLDEPVTIPKRMIATGYLRNYIEGAGETKNCSKRLEKIAHKWKVPIDFVGTCAP